MNGRVDKRGIRMCSTPIHMGFERTVAGFAAHAALGHHGMVAIGGRIIIFMKAGVVAFGTEGIPVHAPAGPVAKFTWITKIVAINIKPLVRLGIVGGFMHLITPPGKRGQKLNQREITKDAFHLKWLTVAIYPKSDNLALASGELERSRFCAMPQSAGGQKRGQIQIGLDRAFGEGMMGGFPQVVVRLMTTPAAIGTGIGGIVGGLSESIIGPDSEPR